MNKKRIRIVLCLMILMNVGTAIIMSHKKKPAHQDLILGDWSGILDAGVMKMNTILHIQKNVDGTLYATLDNLSVKALGIPIDVITFKDNHLHFQLENTAITFEGELIKDQTQISGKILQNGQEFSLALEKGLQAIKETKRPQEPFPPYPYKEELVSYKGGKADITLSGTLTLPSSNGPFPALILIAGSGPHDRNEEIFGHKPFLVLADHLTKKGIAVLRFDKRGCGKSTGSYDMATTQDFAEDVLAGISYLKSLPEIRSDQIGLIGHSEGGIIAPMVAGKSKDIAFLVLAAAPALTGEEILYEQNASLLRLSGDTQETIEELTSWQKQVFAILKKESNANAAISQIQELAKEYSNLPQEKQKNIVINFLSGSTKMCTPWFRYFLSFDPSIVLKQVQVPVLAINGELDIQVSSKHNLPVLERSLEEAGNPDYKVLELPSLNHLFQTCTNGSIREYGEIEETLSPSALNIISEWILEKVL